MRRAITTALAVAALGGLGWLAYDRITANDPTAPPLIRADDGPLKIRPKDPGGMAVPDQDKLIYQTLNGGIVEETVERLLPPPEEPLPAPEPPKPAVVEEPPAAATPALPPAEIDPQAETATQAVAPLPEPEVAPEPEEPSAAPPPPPETPTPEAAEAAAPAAPAAATGSYMVQLASFRAIDDADKAWRKAIKNNGDLLSAFSARVVRADLGDQGVYYRLRVGPFAKREAAKTLCAKLKARSVDCIVVAKSK